MAQDEVTTLAMRTEEAVSIPESIVDRVRGLIPLIGAMMSRLRIVRKSRPPENLQ